MRITVFLCLHLVDCYQIKGIHCLHLESRKVSQVLLLMFGRNLLPPYSGQKNKGQYSLPRSPHSCLFVEDSVPGCSPHYVCTSSSPFSLIFLEEEGSRFQPSGLNSIGSQKTVICCIIRKQKMSEETENISLHLMHKIKLQDMDSHINSM